MLFHFILFRYQIRSSFLFEILFSRIHTSLSLRQITYRHYMKQIYSISITCTKTTMFRFYSAITMHFNSYICKHVFCIFRAGTLSNFIKKLIENDKYIT